MGSDIGDWVPSHDLDENCGGSPDRGRSRSPSQTSDRSRSRSSSRTSDRSDRSQSEESEDRSSRSSNTSPARYRNLWAMGRDPREWPDQQASTSDAYPSERERLSKMQAVRDWIESSVGNVFENTRPEDLLEELAIAKSLGVKPMHVDDPGFRKVANEEDTSLKWAVTESGDLLFVPSSVGGEEIAHTVLTQGGPIVAAGEAIIVADGNERLCIEITHHSGHSQPNSEGLEIGKQAFKAFGITFLGESASNRFDDVEHVQGQEGEEKHEGEGWEGIGGRGGGHDGGDGGKLVVYDSSSDEDNKDGGADAAAQKIQEAAAKLEESWEDRTFRSERRFVKHCNDHLSEWSPALTVEQYLAKARELLSAPPDANIEGFISESGQYIYKYNNATNEFAIGMADGVISTFYKPDEGRTYWLSEIKKNGGPHVFGGK